MAVIARTDAVIIAIWALELIASTFAGGVLLSQGASRGWLRTASLHAPTSDDQGPRVSSMLDHQSEEASE